MRALTTIALSVAAILLLAFASPATAAFGLEDIDLSFREADGSVATKAGSHPGSMSTSIGVSAHVGPDGEVPDAAIKDLTVDFPPGFVGARAAVPYCSTADFVDREVGRSGCPDASALGFVALTIASLPIEAGAGEGAFLHVPVYNLAPAPGYAAKIGFVALDVPVIVNVGVSQEPPYRVTATTANTSQAVLFYKSVLTVWGNPAHSSHDPYRGKCIGEDQNFTQAPVSLGNCPVDISVRPFLTMPRSCMGPLLTSISANSWQDPGTTVSQTVPTRDDATPPNPIGTGGCSTLKLSPEMSTRPTSIAAESPTGLDFTLALKDDGIGSPTGTAASDLKKAVVTLPEGMTVNPSSAEGLEVCGEADLARETLSPVLGEGCPDASKLGTLAVRSPVLDETLEGSLFLAEPYRNPLGTLIALYMVIEDPELGILVKQAGKVEPDPRTGQLVTTFDELPQLPLENVKLRFREGPRSPLVTPPTCGTYTTEAKLTPWANPESPVTVTSSFEVQAGSGGAGCPAGGTPPFSPGFLAGSDNNDAGAFSPFQMRFTRRDGDQDLTRLSAKLPPGMIARLAGTTQCPDASIDGAKGRAGLDELATPSCPSSSRIGRVLAGAGVGAILTYVPGSLYLGGPYNGAPLSAVAVVPAVAGPFDVGTVVTRFALRIDPRSAEVSVDGAASDPIPHILAGIPLKVRDVRAYVDRPQFTFNPTSCEPFSVDAVMWGGGADPFSSGDDSPVSLAERFQAAGCAGLGFSPKLALTLKGGMKRGDNPALRGVYTPRPGQANLKKLVLRLPRSAFLEQGHIRTICTRVQFAAKSCPKGSVYGRVKAWTPLLDEPLSGPVYLRSSSNELPDFVADLKGLVDVEAVARIDSVRGGIRATFTELPDAPISRVVVDMQGGKKGLIVNSTNLCRRANRADGTLFAHNAKRSTTRPVVRAAGCKKRKRAK